jgi:cob(I)alamin adenosyltransferase
MKIYTKKGDSGQTSLVGGTMISKGEQRIEAYGTVDELNSWIGLLRDEQADDAIKVHLKEIQDTLFVIGSHLATEDAANASFLPKIEEDWTLGLERAIDLFDKELPALKHFILPGGHPYISRCHIARCVCRRAERHVVRLAAMDNVESSIIIYLNRLSDYLFTLARKCGADMQLDELIWLPKK